LFSGHSGMTVKGEFPAARSPPVTGTFTVTAPA